MGKLIVEGAAYEFDFERMTNVEVMAIQRVTNMKFKEWIEATTESDMLAITALVWVVMKRDRPDLRFDDVEFQLDAIDLEDDEDEAEAEGPGKDAEALGADKANSRKKSTSTRSRSRASTN